MSQLSENFIKKPDLIVIAVSSKGIDWIADRVKQNFKK